MKRNNCLRILEKKIFSTFFILMHLTLYRCRVPSCDDKSSSYETDFLNFTIPYDYEDEEWEQCDRYSSRGRNQTTVFLPLSNNARSPPRALAMLEYLGETRSECSAEYFDDSETIDCDEGYVYDTTVISSSTVIEVRCVFDMSIISSTEIEVRCQVLTECASLSKRSTLYNVSRETEAWHCYIRSKLTSNPYFL